jgi:hypothetical protein
MNPTRDRPTLAATLAIVSAFLLQGCADLHSHCEEYTERQVMTQVCEMTNNGICVSYRLDPNYVSTCVRTECDDGYERIGGKCVAVTSSASAPSRSNAPKKQLDLAAREAYLNKMARCKGWKVSSNDDLTAASLIGENLCSNRMQTWLSKMGSTQQTDNPSEPHFISLGGIYRLDFPPRGISLDFSAADILIVETIYSEHVGPLINQYEGKLPYGLTFDLKREQVERILGQPDSSGCMKTLGCWGIYNSKGIGQILYASEKPGDQNARMLYMIISKNIR